MNDIRTTLYGGVPKIQWQQTLPLATGRGKHPTAAEPDMRQLLNDLGDALRLVLKYAHRTEAGPYALWAERKPKALVLTAWWVGIPALAAKLHRLDPRFTRLTPQDYDAAVKSFTEKKVR